MTERPEIAATASEDGAYLRLLHYSHLFASVVRGTLEDRCLRQVTQLRLTIPQVNLLRLIDHSGTHGVGEMADLLGMSQPAASKNVDKLVRMKLVERQVQESDRRTTALYLTEEGGELIRRYEQLKEEKLKQALGSLGAREMDALTEGLEKMSYLILKGESSQGICIRCSAYYTNYCPLRSLAISCSYLKNR
jgi:DNA-binding MarR family transcriptional regulator